MVKISSRMVFEIMGRPPEHISEALNTLVVKLDSEKGVEVVNKKYHDVKKVEDADNLFHTFAEVEADFSDLNSFFGIIFNYMPANIEIFDPDKLKINNISLINRTFEKAIFLKKKFNFLEILEWKSLSAQISKFDIIVNATSLGLKNSKDFEFDFENVKDNLIYIDTIYNPIQTKTIKFLSKKNIRTFNGLDMFIYQGQKSFYLWNKINPEISNDLVNLLKSKLS